MVAGGKIQELGAQTSAEQYDKVLGYLQLGKEEGAKVLTGGEAVSREGYFIQPTVLQGHQGMRIFQEEIFGPVAYATTFCSTEEAIAMANDSVYGLGAGVWTRDTHEAYQVPRALHTRRVWVNCYHLYPSHAPFGGYKQSGFGRECHKMALSHYRNVKNMLVSYDTHKLGFY